MASVFGKTYSANDSIIKEAKKQAGVAENRELDRQARLEYGRALVNALFKGGSYAGMKLDRTVTDKKTGEESALKYDKKKTYYNKDGTVWKPKAQVKGKKTITGTKYKTIRELKPKDRNREFIRAFFGFGDYPGGPNKDNYLERRVAYPFTTTVDTLTGPNAASQFEDAKNLYANKGGSFSGIGDDFYDQYRKAILDFQVPDLQKQLRGAKSQDLFSMARQGIMNSSSAIARGRERTDEYGKSLANINSGAEAQVTGLESDVDAARRRTLALLESSESPTSAINEGLTEINAVQSQSPDLQPLGDIFQAAAQGFQSYQNTQQQRQYNDLIRSVSANRNSGRTYR
jgi:hypothetical protein